MLQSVFYKILLLLWNCIYMTMICIQQHGVIMSPRDHIHQHLQDDALNLEHCIRKFKQEDIIFGSIKHARIDSKCWEDRRKWVNACSRDYHVTGMIMKTEYILTTSNKTPACFRSLSWRLRGNGQELRLRSNPCLSLMSGMEVVGCIYKMFWIMMAWYQCW